jgi:hypothetical protein
MPKVNNGQMGDLVTLVMIAIFCRFRQFSARFCYFIILLRWELIL